jgi:hypothetical protein
MVEWIRANMLQWDIGYRNVANHGIIVRDGCIVAPVAAAIELWNRHYIYGDAWANGPLILDTDGSGMSFPQYLEQVVKPLQDQYLAENS